MPIGAVKVVFSIHLTTIREPTFTTFSVDVNIKNGCKLEKLHFICKLPEKPTIYLQFKVVSLVVSLAMEVTTASGVLQRLKEALSAKSDSEVARLLGISQQAISNAKANNKLPDAWVRIAAERFELSADWLFFGRGSMRPLCAPSQQIPREGHQESQVHSTPQEIPSPTETCPQCAVLKEELRIEREERREATATVLKLYREKEGLLRENAELKIQLARLEATNSAPSSKRNEPSALGVVLVDEPLQHASPGSCSRARQVELNG